MRVTTDPLNPSYYQRGGFHLAEVIDAWNLSRWATQAVQYIFRAAFKGNQLQDLLKAREQLEREIERVRAEEDRAWRDRARSRGWMEDGVDGIFAVPLTCRRCPATARWALVRGTRVLDKRCDDCLRFSEAER